MATAAGDVQPFGIGAPTEPAEDSDPDRLLQALAALGFDRADQLSRGRCVPLAVTAHAGERLWVSFLRTMSTSTDHGDYTRNCGHQWLERLSVGTRLDSGLGRKASGCSSAMEGDSEDRSPVERILASLRRSV